MELKGVQDTCQRIENGTDPLWLRISCPYLHRRYCILTWCRDFAFCLKQSIDWQEECSQRIYERRLTNINVDSVGNGPSYSFDVERCSKPWRWLIYVKIRLINGTLQEYGMHRIPFVIIMKVCIIYFLIHMPFPKSIRRSVHLIIPSFLRSCEN